MHSLQRLIQQCDKASVPSLDSDLILHVVDGSDADPEGQIRAVREVLAEIDATHLPELIVFNKADIVDSLTIDELLRRYPEAIAVSAATGLNVDLLVQAIETKLPWPQVDIKATIPYDRGDLLAKIYREGQVLSRTDTEQGTVVVARVPQAIAAAIESLQE